jgi:nitronate monooxygenase
MSSAEFHSVPDSCRLLLDLLGIAIPIIQAPIGSLASPELAAEVSNSGGLGSLALTWANPEHAAALVAEVRRRSSRPFCVNFVLAFEPSALNAALEAGVPVVSFSWGLPGPLVKHVKSFGARVGIQVGSIEGAKRALDSGCDFLIGQGVEAGGHVQSSTPLLNLLPSLVSLAKSIPVVAAGGIVDGDDIAASLKSGACGAMLGTRFVACTESLAHPEYKAALVAADGEDTVLTGCFDGGWPYAQHRVLRNSTFKAWEAQGCLSPGRRPGEGEIVSEQANSSIRRYEDTPPSLNMRGDILACCLYAGSGVGKIRDIQPANTLTRNLWRDTLGIWHG